MQWRDDDYENVCLFCGHVQVSKGKSVRDRPCIVLTKDRLQIPVQPYCEQRKDELARAM